MCDRCTYVTKLSQRGKEGRGAGATKRKRRGAWKRRDYIAAAVVVCTFGSMALLYLHMMDQFS